MALRSLVFLILAFSAFSVHAQNNEKKKNTRPAASPTPEQSEALEPGKPVYFYDFEKPEFLVSSVHIEHDENGAGTVTFEKKLLEESFTIKLLISGATMDLLVEHWSNLISQDPYENLQSKNEYPHLGTMKLRMITGEKSREAEFNWTDNVDAKTLTDTYKKIGYEYVWKFEIDVARKNQPLESPRIMKKFDLYLQRGEIADPFHMVPYLMELSKDERMPLIARNHAKRIAESIEKMQKKKIDN